MKLNLILVFIVLSSSAFSQSDPVKFVDALINNSDNIRDFIDESELTRSERLGITYTGVKDKFLIGYDIDEQIKNDMKEGRRQYAFKETILEGGYSQIVLGDLSSKYTKLFYFRDGKFISPTTYLTRNWQTKESKYFIFKISEPKYFNDYCIKRLDDFVDKIADTLGFTGSERELLQKKKIYYIFCKDENEVQALTGYKSKGQAILAFDEVITAYQTHFHELSHLLINYKLKNLGLYTLPFFMEGFAVAMGGRGGMAPRVVTDVGYYLQKTAFLTYDSILTYDAFTSQDASMTYAVSGLYNMFLFNELGAYKYLELYKKVNGDLEYVRRIKPSKVLLPDSSFNTFLIKYDEDSILTFSQSESTPPPPSFLLGSGGGFVEIDNNFKFFIFDVYRFGPNDKQVNNDYKSRTYLSLFPNRIYDGIKYAVIVDDKSVEIYNFYNNEILLNRLLQFSVKPFVIPKYNGDSPYKGTYVFFVKKNLFEESFLNGYLLDGDFR